MRHKVERKSLTLNRQGEGEGEDSMGLLWSKAPSEDYERILSDLTTRITEQELFITELRHRERRWSVWVLSYGALLYILHALYVFFYPRGPPALSYRPLLDAIGLLFGPLVVYYGRRLIAWLYGKRLAHLEASLRALRAKQKLKVPCLLVALLSIEI